MVSELSEGETNRGRSDVIVALQLAPRRGCSAHPPCGVHKVRPAASIYSARCN